MFPVPVLAPSRAPDPAAAERHPITCARGGRWQRRRLALNRDPFRAPGFVFGTSASSDGCLQGPAAAPGQRQRLGAGSRFIVASRKSLSESETSAIASPGRTEPFGRSRLVRRQHPGVWLAEAASAERRRPLSLYRTLRRPRAGGTLRIRRAKGVDRAVQRAGELVGWRSSRGQRGGTELRKEASMCDSADSRQWNSGGWKLVVMEVVAMLMIMDCG